MTHLDLCGCPVTSDTPAAREGWNRLTRSFLSHDAKAGDDLASTLKDDPQFALAQACRGIFSLLLGRRELTQTAQEAYDAARLSLRHADHDARSQAYTDALGHYLDGHLFQAADVLDHWLTKSPHDLVAVKLSHAIRFMMGDLSGMRRSLEMVRPAYGNATRLDGYFNGCYAFALEETGAYTEAEKAGRRALELAPDDAWGLHAVAHVFDMTTRAGDGVRWLERRTDAWRHCNNFRYHVWWHLALFYLDAGDYAEVLRLYDEEIRQDRTDDYRDISNGASLLSRLEIEGVDIGDRWEELATLSEARVEDGCAVFADLHYMLSLIGGDRIDAAGQLLSRMRADACRSMTDMDRVADHPGLNAAAGLMAFGEGHYTNAHANLSAAHRALQNIGGSHAQRDVFERITVEAALRAGALDDARLLLETRDARRADADAFTRSRLATIDALRHEDATSDPTIRTVKPVSSRTRPSVVEPALAAGFDGW
ncbi:MAG: tetratricopeptide repeat protein [Pseudomonadota bacterium]